METYPSRHTMHHLYDRQAKEFLHHPQADSSPTQQQRPSLVRIHILRQLFLKEKTNTKCSTSHFKKASFTKDLVMWSRIKSDDSPKTSYAKVNRITSIWHLLTKGCTDNSERNYELVRCLNAKRPDGLTKSKRGFVEPYFGLGLSSRSKSCNQVIIYSVV